MQGPTKFTQIGNFGLKICHLATMLRSIVIFFSKNFSIGSERFQQEKQTIHSPDP
jgi:hypothetical protein